MTDTAAAPAAKMVKVVLVHPATYPEDVKNPAKTQLSVPLEVARNWEAAGVAIKL